jgi:excisionase family DNA binding protein
MSSNIKVQKICQHCGKEFTARTTTTLYCSHQCNSAAYKAKKRALKVESTTQETRQIVTKSIELLNKKEFLSVKETALLLGCSRQTVYALINSGKLKGVNISTKKTIIQRSEIDKLFEN